MDVRGHHEGTMKTVATPGRVRRAVLVLTRACPADLRVLYAPLDVAIADDTVLQPDLIVARRSDFGERDLPVAPLLAIEVLSPTTRRVDLTLKRSRYETAGCLSYWVIDPDRPALTAWQLVDGAYVQVADVTGDEEYAATAPYHVTLAPAELLG